MQRTDNYDNMALLPEIDAGFRELMDALPFGAQLIDAEHKIVAVNKTLRRKLDLEESQLVGEHCTVVIHGFNAPAADCPLEEALAKGIPVERELFDSKNNQWVLASVYPTNIINSEGLPVYLHFIRDITEIKEMDAELTRSLEHHKALYDLLQNLQNCRNETEIIDVLIDQVLSLSWLGMAATAVGFLFNGKELDLVSHRNVTSDLLNKCNRIAPGVCLCGKALETRRPVICSSSSHIHTIKYEGMAEHGHAVLPIMHKGNILGVLTLYLNSGDSLDNFRTGFLKAAVAAAGAALDAQRAREQAVQAQEKCLANIISSQEAERKRVAEDLHDKLCQSLSAILLELQSKESRNAYSEPDLLSIKSQVRDLIDQVRQMAGQLRPSILDDFGLESALAHKIEEISSFRGIQIDYQCVPATPGVFRLPSAVEVGLYRVAMEAILNAITHAQASLISVILLKQQNKATLLIEDDGCGFDYTKVRRDMDRAEGLIEMEERMVVLGGKLEIESTLRKGTTVRAEVPINTETQRKT